MSPSPRRSRRSRLLGWLSRVVARRARLIIIVWILSLAVLGFLGRDLEKNLSSQPVYIDGTATKRAHEISEREFGSDYSVIVMLRGPSGEVERQGRELARRLGEMPGALVISPWLQGASLKGLRPDPGTAALVVRVDADNLDTVLPPVERVVDRTVSGPVRARVAGFPAIVEALFRSTEEAVRVGELIAAPVLLLVLFLVFRSVLAALVPLVVGGAVVAITRGLLSLMLGLFEIDLLAAGIISMLALGLGVDYSLLVVSRFREEQRRGDAMTAASETVRATSRSLIPAGSGLLMAMAVSALVLPGRITTSISVAVGVATLVSMVSAICVVPAVLRLLGPNLDRWSLPIREGSQIAPLRWSRRIVRHPRMVVAMMLVLALCSALAFNLDSNLASLSLLPSSDPDRLEQEDVVKGLGPGWLAPMEVVVSGRGQTVVSTQRLNALAQFQHRVERDPGVEAMGGFVAIQKGVSQLDGIEEQLAGQERGMGRLAKGISRINDGAGQTSSGLLAAARGSGALATGVGAADRGAGAIAGGLQATSEGSSRMTDGLARASDGSGKLADGTAKASSGAGRLADGLDRARKQTGEIADTAQLFKSTMGAGEDRLEEAGVPLRAAEGQLAAALQALQRMTSGRADPEYASVLAAVEEASRKLAGRDPGSGEVVAAGVAEGIERGKAEFGVGTYLATKLAKNGRKADEGMGKLADAASRLGDGLEKLEGGSSKVAEGVAALSGGGERLTPALQRLAEGAESLSGGLDRLQDGAGQLAEGLTSGAERSGLMTKGLSRIEEGIESQRGDSQLSQLQQRSPGLFKSPYFVLASLDGSPAQKRRQLATLVNLDRGAQDARMLVIPSDEQTSEAAIETKERLTADAEDLARRTGAEVVVGGAAPAAMDANAALRDEAPLTRIVLSLISMLILIPVLRSLIVPLLAALMNLVTVAASFGLMSLLFNGSLLGGPGFVDSTVLTGCMIVMFGLAIDYEVFVFARIREEYVRTGSTDAAIRGGLDRTAHVVTGAAVIMIAVFLAFSVSDLISIRNFGVAQSIGVFIDAFIVRLIFVPAAMGWLGKWCWWMPRWLDRLLPGRSHESLQAELAAAGSR